MLLASRSLMMDLFTCIIKESCTYAIALCIQNCISSRVVQYLLFFFFQAEDGIRDVAVTGVQTCALPILEVRARELSALNLQIAKQESDLTDDRKHFMKQRVELADRQGKMERGALAIAKREEAIGKREAGLGAKVADLEDRHAVTQESRARLATEKQELQTVGAELQTAKKEVASRAKELADLDAKLKDVQGRITVKEGELRKREELAEKTKAMATEILTAMETRGRQLKNQQKMLEDGEAAIATADESVAASRAKIEEFEKELRDRE